MTAVDDLLLASFDARFVEALESMTSIDGTLLALLLMPAGLAVFGLVLVYRYRERLKHRSPYAYYGLIIGIVMCYSGISFYFSLVISGLLAGLIILGEVAVLGVFLAYRYPEQLKNRSQYAYHGLILGSVILGVVVSYFLLTARYYTPPSECSAHPCIFAGGLCTLVSVTVVSVALLCVSLLYLFRRPLKEKFPYIFYGVIAIVLLVGGAAVAISTSPVIECGPFSEGVSISQQGTGDVVKMTVVDTGGTDLWGLIGPDGTRSTMADFDAGTRFTLRSKDEIIRYLNDPGNNITVLTTSGTKTVESVGELPSEYQKAPDGLINPDADISGYDNASMATAACLVSHDGFRVGEKHVPANVTVPCNTPVLAQNKSMLAQNGSASGPPLGIITATLVLLVVLVALYRHRELLKADSLLRGGQSESKLLKIDRLLRGERSGPRLVTLFVLGLIGVILLVGALVAGFAVLDYSNAQDDSTTVGTSVKPTSGPNAGKTLTSPIILRSGEYTVVGRFDGEEYVVETFMTEEGLREQEESNESD